MYNRYIPNGTAYTRIPVEEDHSAQEGSPPGAERPRNQGRRQEPGGGFSLPSFLTGEGGAGGLGGLLKALKLENLDSGDILLLLIVLLLLWEGDDLELVIALGLVLILGLGDGEEGKET